MKVKHILDYFGPRVTCSVKVKYLGEDKYVYEKDDDYPEDEELLESHVLEIGIENDDYPYLEITVERDNKW